MLFHEHQLDRCSLLDLPNRLLNHIRRCKAILICFQQISRRLAVVFHHAHVFLAIRLGMNMVFENGMIGWDFNQVIILEIFFLFLFVCIDPYRNYHQYGEILRRVNNF